MKRCIMMVVAVAAIAGAATRVYDVELSQNDNAMTPEDGWVGQRFIATCDSVLWVSAFIGRPDTAHYFFRIFDSTGTRWVSSEVQVSATDKQYQYVTAVFAQACTVTKGVKYMLKIWHSRGDPVNYYYNRDSSVYHYGELWANGQKTGYDLAARVEGVHNVVPREFWGINAFQGDSTTGDARKAASYIRELGIKLVRDDLCWNELQKDSSDREFSRLDWRVKAYADSGLMMQAKLNYSAIWFNADSTDTFCTTGPSPDTVSGGDSLRGRGILQFGWGCYPPMRLSGYEPVDHDSVNRENWWAYYVYRIIKRFGPNSTVLPETVRIKYWEVWNEPELRGFWGHPNTYYIPRGDTIGDRHPDPPLGGQPQASRDSMTQLYISLCRIAHVAAKQADSDAKLIGLVLSKPLYGRSSSSWEIKGLELAKKYYEKGGDTLSDGVSFHPYQWPWPSSQRYWIFDPRELEEEIDSMRVEMAKGDGNHVGKLLWLTEWGWITKPDMDPGVTDSQQAHAITDMIFTSVGSSGRPQGGCDHISLFMLRDENGSDSMLNHWGIVKNDWTRKPGFYALKQGIAKLKDLVFNRRVLTGDLGKDSLVRIYEFEDTASGKKTWVAWKNPRKLGNDATLINVAIPSCTNVDSTMRCAYDNNPPRDTIPVGSDGYASINLDERPYFIYETGQTLRPNLIVDSIWTSPNPPQVNNPVRVYAKIKNTGNDSTKPGIADSIIFYVDGVKKAWVVYDSAIHQNSSATVFRDSVWTPDTTRPYLVKVAVNGSRVFMELSFDNNARYRMYDISYLPPTGSIAVNKDSSLTNVPAVSLYLQSYNPNKSGNQPADSMSIWEVIPPDSMVQLSFGYVPFDSFKYYPLSRLTRGKKKFCVKYRITEGGLESSTYADSIIFDQTPPESIRFVINHDSLYTSSQSCTLCSHVLDSTSGTYQMRFGNKSLANLVLNSAMNDSASWLKKNTDYDSIYKYFTVNSVTSDTSFLRQDIDNDTFYNHIQDGDTLSLAGDLVTDHFKGTGYLRFQYMYGPPDSVKADSVDSIVTGVYPTIPQGSAAYVGRYNLASTFQFDPDPPSGEYFKKGRVEVFVTSSGTNSGKIIADNIRLDPVGPQYRFSRFVAHDSIRTGWHLDSVNNKQVVFAQYQDSAGNETHLVWDTITVDTVKPNCQILSPYDSQTVSSTITITGHAHDSVVDPPHFWKYNLDYQIYGSGTWCPVDPESVSTTPVYPVLIGMPDSLGHWNTTTVSDTFCDLRVLVKDKAGNQAVDTVYGVYVSNADPPGGDGDGFGGFGGEAEAMSLDKDDNLYLVSTETPADQIDLRVRKYSATGESLLAFSAKLTADSTRIPWPSGLVIDDSSRIFLLDGLNNCLKVFDKAGKFLVKVGSRGSGQGQFINPSDLKWDGSGKTKLFITDKGNKRVQVLAKQGSFLRQFGTDSIPLNNPIALVHNSQNQTCVLDVQNDTGKLFVYDSTGKLRRTVTKFNLKNPTASTIDSKDNLFIADAGNKRILELSPILTHIYSFGTEGDSFGQFRNPTALTITKDRRYLYVYDRTKKTISKFTMIKSKKRGGGGSQSEALLEILPTQLLLYAPKPNPAKRIVTLKYAVPRQEKISLVIYDIVGRQARTITNRLHKPGFYSQAWDGKDDRGNELAAGVYFCLLKDDEKVLTKKVVLVR